MFIFLVFPLLLARKHEAAFLPCRDFPKTVKNNHPSAGYKVISRTIEHKGKIGCE
jgi:hypothetical protein